MVQSERPDGLPIGVCERRVGGTPIDGLIERHTVRRMGTVTVSPKVQVVIPQKIRDAIGLRSGDKIKVVAFRNRIELLPMRAIRTLRGYLKGIDTSLKRDEARL